MRRISDALDAPGGLEADEALRAILADDADAARYAADLAAIDEALGGLGAGRDEPDWEAMLDRIEDRLDADLEGLRDIGDPTVPPAFEDLAEDEVVEPIVPRAAAASVVSVAAAPVAKAAPSAEVVDLAARRKQRRQVFSLIGGLAAAAAVGLGITAGLSMSADEAPSAGFAMEQAERAAPAAPAMAEVPAAAPAEVALADDFAEAEEPTAAEPSPITAAGAFQPGARGVSRSSGAAPADALAAGGLGLDGVGGGGGGGFRTDTSTAPAATRAVREPTRAEVVNALNEVSDAVARCIRRTGEVAQVRVRVNGATGAVESVTVEPPYVGAEAACVVRAVRTASMPTSPSPYYEATHPYHPAGPAGGSLGSPASAARRRERAPVRLAPARPAAREQASDVLSPWAEKR
ncbi:MAG: hypothetical protein R3B82_29150 [Sandaracinaceae bacterium]